MTQLASKVYELVSKIPPGQVTTYGQLAVMAGVPGAARAVGNVMAHAPTGLPCHRVVSADGSVLLGEWDQRSMLEAEGVQFNAAGRVPLALYRWNPARR